MAERRHRKCHAYGHMGPSCKDSRQPDVRTQEAADQWVPQSKQRTAVLPEARCLSRTSLRMPSKMITTEDDAQGRKESIIKEDEAQWAERAYRCSSGQESHELEHGSRGDILTSLSRTKTPRGEHTGTAPAVAVLRHADYINAPCANAHASNRVRHALRRIPRAPKSGSCVCAARPAILRRSLCPSKP